MILIIINKNKMKNSEIINGTYYYGKNMPPQINTPSAIKIPVKIKVF